MVIIATSTAATPRTAKISPMSEWYRPDKDDIDIDSFNEEVDIYVTHNDFGSIYLTLTFEQIQEIAAQTVAPQDHNRQK